MLKLRLPSSLDGNPKRALLHSTHSIRPSKEELL